MGRGFWYKTQLFLAGVADRRARNELNTASALAPERIWSVFLSRGITMAKVCQVTGKRPVTGNNVSHANNRTKRRFLPNLQTHRFWVESENRFVKLRLTAKGMRIIDKKGIDTVLAEVRARGEKV